VGSRKTEGRPLTQDGVTSTRVLPALVEAEDGHAGFGLVPEAVLTGELTFEAGEKGLPERAFVGTADGTHGGVHASMLAPAAGRERWMCGTLGPKGTPWLGAGPPLP